ncbi:MAG: substrate-binding domain-containing protein [Lentisphaerae bacterium]|nr:substrate-binding domain-containing protein [Lentisphaerota bacterium]
MRRLLVHLLVAAVAASITSCGKSPPAGSETGSALPVIAVIPKGTTHEFWKSIHAGAVKAAREIGVEIVWKGPLKEDDRDAQIEVVENMIGRGAAGIVLAPLDDMALRMPVASATKAGIPVVIIDSDLKSDDYVSFVATDNRAGGYAGGKRLAELIGGEGKVIMLRYAEGSASTMNREQGFLDAMAEHPGIEVVSANQYGGATTESAYRASENLLAPFKTAGGLTVQGIFCPNESTTFGMLRALQDAGLAGKVSFVGFDSSEKLVQALSAGHIHGLVLQDPMNMGYMGVKTLAAHLRGEKVDRRIDTGSTVATPENMNDAAVAALLKPDFSAWLK